MRQNVVSIVKGPQGPAEQEIDSMVRRAIELVGGLSGIAGPGDTVLIKPNLILAKSPDTGAVTDPRVCKSVANLVKELGARPIIAESSAVGIDTEQAFQVAGYDRLRGEGYEVIDLKKEETVTVPLPKGKSLKEVSFPRVVVEAKAIISVPSMKTHDQPPVTLSLKNMKGVLPDTFKRKFHTTFGIFQGVADLCTAFKPALAVVDGIIAMEGLGPIFGEPVEMDLIIAGRDPVAVDAVTATIMGVEPGEDGTISAATKSRIGISDLSKLQLVGEPIANVQRRFKLAVEAIYETVPLPKGFELLLAEKACTGCRNTVLSVLVDLKEQNQLDRAAGWCVIAGKIDKVPEVERDYLLLAGNCTARFKRRGVFVPGCPPNNRDIAGGILREEQEARWA
ncbi:MAG TPA: DUF362 domain-containing protein [Dehalococcoidia bacterium]|nr:DUF362 domain-containing protein [Dehalococcoidia bacterium]